VHKLTTAVVDRFYSQVQKWAAAAVETPGQALDKMGEKPSLAKVRYLAIAEINSSALPSRVSIRG
jgi:hypothetical protein